MAITIISQPPLHTPAYNEQYFVASGTNITQPNFRYICNVLINGELIQVPFNARPDNGWVMFNPQRIVESAVLNTWDNSIAQISRANDSIQKVVIGIDEEYGTTPVQYNGASGTYFVWNAAYTSVDYKSYSYALGTTSKSLTTLTGNKIYYNQRNAFLYWHRGFSSAPLYYMIITCFNSAGGVVQNLKILNNYNGFTGTTGAGTAVNGIIYANCSPYGLDLLKATNPADVIVQSTGGVMIPTTTAYYDVSFTTIGGIDDSASFRITIDSFCSKYPKTALSFLNGLGGYDWFVFNRVRRVPSSKKTSDYKKLPFDLDANNNYTYDLQKGDTVNYSTLITNKLVLNSNYLTNAEAILLKDLMNSPDVKYEDENGLTQSIQIIDKDYEPKTKVVDKLIQLTINAEFTYEDIRQRG